MSGADAVVAISFPKFEIHFTRAYLDSKTNVRLVHTPQWVNKLLHDRLTQELTVHDGGAERRAIVSALPFA